MFRFVGIDEKNGATEVVFAQRYKKGKEYGWSRLPFATFARAEKYFKERGQNIKEAENYAAFLKAKREAKRAGGVITFTVEHYRATVTLKKYKVKAGSLAEAVALAKQGDGESAILPAYTKEIDQTDWETANEEA